MYQYIPQIRTEIHTRIHTNTERWYWYVLVRIKFQYVHYTSLMQQSPRYGPIFWPSRGATAALLAWTSTSAQARYDYDSLAYLGRVWSRP